MNTKKTILTVLFVIVILFNWGCNSSIKHKNVIIITVDTLRADHLGAYGHPDVYSPAMDRFFKSSVQVINGYTPIPTTLPAHASLFTGMYPYQHGLRANAGYIMKKSGVDHLAEILSGKGYFTGAFCSMEALASGCGIGRGFQTIDDDGFQWQRPGRDTVKSALKWMDSHSDDAFLAWIHLFEPHAPYAPPSPLPELYQHGKDRFLKNIDRGMIPSIMGNHPGTDAGHYEKMYEGEILEADGCVDRVMNHLKNSNLYEDALIILTADHGECLGERDLFYDHSWRLAEATLHIPLGVKDFHRHPQIWNDEVNLIDLPSYVLNSLKIAGDFHFEGSFPFQPRQTSRPFLFELGPNELEPDQRIHAVRQGKHKFFYAPKPEMFWWMNHSEEYVNLEIDPGERWPVYGSAENVQHLKTILDNFLSDDVETGNRKEITDTERSRLKALGYLGGDSEEWEEIKGKKNRITDNAAGKASPEIVSPENGSEWYRLPTFRWTSVEDATGYRIQFFSPLKPEIPIELKSIKNNLQDKLTPELWMQLDPGIYRWSVAAEFKSGHISSFSPHCTIKRVIAPYYSFQHDGVIVMEAEDLPSNTGRIIARKKAFHGEVRCARPGDESNYMVFGPYIQIPPGQYQVDFILKSTCRSSDVYGWCDVVGGHGEIILAQASFPLATFDLEEGENFRTIRLKFRCEGDEHMEFRVFYPGKGTIWVDRITLKILGSD